MYDVYDIEYIVSHSSRWLARPTPGLDQASLVHRARVKSCGVNIETERNVAREQRNLKNHRSTTMVPLELTKTERQLQKLAVDDDHIDYHEILCRRRRLVEDRDL